MKLVIPSNPKLPAFKLKDFVFAVIDYQKKIVKPAVLGPRWLGLGARDVVIPAETQVVPVLVIDTEKWKFTVKCQSVDEANELWASLMDEIYEAIEGAKS